MSTPQAIAAVTDILVKLARDAVDPGVTVTARPLDLVRTNETGTQVNLFLYHIAPNAAWRNLDPPGLRPGNQAAPPLLPLRLWYLLTAYGANDPQQGLEDDPFAQEQFGRVMLAFHNNAILPRSGQFPGGVVLNSVLDSGLDKQVESVRLTLQPLTLDDLYKLYGLQTNLRLTVSYEASVVLIDSGLPTVSALPVVSRGQDPGSDPTDPGFPADPLQNLPTIDEARFPLGQAGFLFGGPITLRGRGFSQASFCLEIRHAALPDPYVGTVKPAVAHGDTEVTFRIPNDLDGVPTDAPSWPPGVNFIAGASQVPGGAPGETRRYTSAPVACPLLPRIILHDQNEPDQPTVTQPVGANPFLRLLVQPPPRDTQQVQLLLGGSLVPVQAAFSAGHVVFPLAGQTFTAGDLVRVRVDGVDSPVLVLPVDPKKRAFDPHLKLAVPGGPPP